MRLLDLGRPPTETWRFWTLSLEANLKRSQFADAKACILLLLKRFALTLLCVTNSRFKQCSEKTETLRRLLGNKINESWKCPSIDCGLWMVPGSLLLVQGWWFKVRGSRHFSFFKFFYRSSWATSLEPSALSHEPWAWSCEPWTIWTNWSMN